MSDELWMEVCDVVQEAVTHSNILAWEIPWTEEPGRLVHGVAKSRTQLSTSLHGHSLF